VGEGAVLVRPNAVLLLEKEKIREKSSGVVRGPGMIPVLKWEEYQHCEPMKGVQQGRHMGGPIVQIV